MTAARATQVGVIYNARKELRSEDGRDTPMKTTIKVLLAMVTVAAVRVAGCALPATPGHWEIGKTNYSSTRHKRQRETR
jgi:hypothetical protein